MNRRVTAALIGASCTSLIALLVVSGYCWHMMHPAPATVVPPTSATTSTLPPTMPPATELAELTEPLSFVKNRLTGGIGLLLASGGTEPQILGVVSGSPAEKSGLAVGDIIEEIDGVATRGRPLESIVAQFDGLIGTSVVFRVRSGRTSSRTMTLRRASWRDLKSQTIKAGTITTLNPALDATYDVPK
jgi:membrane-associated protease RseP (regulator of RpoE activity)